MGRDRWNFWCYMTASVHLAGGLFCIVFLSVLGGPWGLITPPTATPSARIILGAMGAVLIVLSVLVFRKRSSHAGR